MIILKREWSKPSTILLATELPACDTNCTLALAQAKEHAADLLVLHVCSLPDEFSSEPGRARAIHRSSRHCLEPLIQRAQGLGIHCKAVVRQGTPVDEILQFIREKKVDRLVMGVHTPGPVGKLLVGSVAEAVMRRAELPVTIAGPYLKGNACRDFLTRTILCSVSSHRCCEAVIRFAAELAAQHSARLILQRVIAPQEKKVELGSHTLEEIGEELIYRVPPELRSKVRIETMVVFGDPTEELLYQSRVLPANLIVMGAHEATHFAAESNTGMVYKVVAYAPCPVITLSPVILASIGPVSETYRSTVNGYLAGVVS